MRARLFPALALAAVSSAGAQARPVAIRAKKSRRCSRRSTRRCFMACDFRMVGPPRGGRVTTVTGVPSQPRTFYMGVASGGLFRTTDAGASWVPITDGKVPVASTGSVAVSESDPNVIYLGTGSDDIRSNVSTGRGVYKSTDGGQTWSFVGLYDAGQIGAVRIHPTNPNIAWVAAIGNAFKHNAERGVFKTTDGGKTWRKVLFLSDSVGAADLELNPANPDIVYAWMWRGERKPWTIISGAHEGRLLQEHRRRRAFHEDHERASHGADRQGEPRGDGGESEPRLRARRGEAGRRSLSLGRRGPVVEADQQLRAAHHASVLLRHARAPIRRMPTSCTAAPRISTSRRTAARTGRPCARRTATTTTCGSIRKTARS